MTPAPNGRVAAVPDLPDYPEPPLSARIAALQAASTFAAGVVLGSSTALSSQDVLRVAETFERWLVRPA
jgi:hypothetical protein